MGAIPDTRISVPIDSLPFDLLVIERLIGERAALEQGLGSRLQQAKEGLRLALSKAATDLSPYGVSAEDINALIEKAVRDAEPKVKAACVSLQIDRDSESAVDESSRCELLGDVTLTDPARYPRVRARPNWCFELSRSRADELAH